jgi:hypothetical protein
MAGAFFAALEQAEIKAITKNMWYFFRVNGLAFTGAIYGFSNN